MKKKTKRTITRIVIGIIIIIIILLLLRTCSNKSIGNTPHNGGGFYGGDTNTVTTTLCVRNTDGYCIGSITTTTIPQCNIESCNRIISPRSQADCDDGGIGCTYLTMGATINPRCECLER